MNRIGIGLLCVASATLMLELTLVRIFDVIWYSNMAYMVITLAMFCFGISGVYFAIRPVPEKKNVENTLVWLSASFAVFSLFLYLVLNYVPFDFDSLYSNFTQSVFYFLIIYLFLIIPFFLAGSIFTVVFSRYANNIQRLYCWDLVGAAIGCILLVPLLPPIGPGGILFVVFGLGVLASACFCSNNIFRTFFVVLAVGVVTVPYFKENYFDFTYYTDKRSVGYMKKFIQPEDVYWDPISKIEVLDANNPVDVLRQVRAAKIQRKKELAGKEDPNPIRLKDFVKTMKHVVYDGGTQSSFIFEFDGDFENLRKELEGGRTGKHFYGEKVWISHALKDGSDQDVLIIGAAGGSEIKAALTFGAGHVDAVEMVGHVVDLGKTTYAEYNGGIFNHPRVNAFRGEGRSFLRASGKQYDIIQMFSNHTSSSIAAGSGAMATTYLQTVEAYEEYFTHLKEDGILHINHHVYPRMITTASRAWKNLGREDFARHVLVLEQAGPNFGDNLPTMLIRMTPWTADECAQVVAIFPKHAQVVVNPMDPAASMLSPEFFSGEMRSELIDKVGYRVAAATDNRPYFNFLRKSFGTLSASRENFTDYSTVNLLNSQLKKDWIPSDVLHLLVTGGASFFFVFLFVFLPLFFSTSGRTPWQGKIHTLVYFSALGGGFIIFELVFIQIFMKLIGFPLYTYSTIVFALLLAAGLGSVVSAKWRISPERNWKIPFWGVLVSSALLVLTHQMIFTWFLQSATLIRIVVAILLVFPVGFFLGMPFPLGILTIEKQPKGAIAWAWAMNGLFTVIGGLASVLLSLYYGFTVTLLVAMGIYAIAFATYSRLRGVVAA